MIDQTPRLVHFILLLLLAFVWGSSFILMKRALFDSDGALLYSAYEVGAMRIVFAGGVLLPFGIRSLRNASRNELKWMLAVGVLGNIIPAFLFTVAQLKLSSSMAGMLNSLTPLFTLVVATFLFKATYSRRQLVGLVIGFVGALGLISQRSGDGDWHLVSALLVVLATLCYAFSVNIIRNLLSELGAVRIASGALLMVAVPAAIWLLLGSNAVEVAAYRPDAMTGLLAVFVLGALGTAGALVIFNQIIKQTSALFASSVTYVIPVFAAMWGVFDGEQLTIYHAIFAGVVLSGVYLVNSSRRKL